MLIVGVAEPAPGDELRDQLEDHHSVGRSLEIRRSVVAALDVDADEGLGPRWVQRLTVDENVTVEGHHRFIAG